MTEFSPSRQRGRNLQYNYLWGAAGLGVTPFAALLFLNIPLIGWRFVFAAGALVAVMTIFLRSRYLSESPRWLALHGRADEAEMLVDQMESTAVQRTGTALPQVPQVPAAEAFEGFPTAALFRRPYLGRMLLTLAFWSVWYITVYAYLGYEPTMLIHMGLSTPSGLLYSALGDLAIPVGAVVVLLLADTWQRKYWIAMVTFVFGAALIVMATSTSSGALFVGVFFSAAMMIAANSMAYVYTAEAFPTRARATATSIGDGVGHIGGAVAPFIVAASLAAMGARGTFWLLAAIVVVSGFIILIGGIRTTGENLTEIAS